jgi:hypothetical protein
MWRLQQHRSPRGFLLSGLQHGRYNWQRQGLDRDVERLTKENFQAFCRPELPAAQLQQTHFLNRQHTNKQVPSYNAISRLIALQEVHQSMALVE